MGHCLGLSHNFQGGPNGYQCDQCNDNDMNNGICPVEATSTNFMDYFPGGYACQNPGFSNCQLSIIHYCLSGKTSISNVVKENPCLFNDSETIFIDSIYSWLCKKQIRGNIHVEDSGILEIKCEVLLSPESQIYIRSGGKLIIDAAP
jgi:hypothetical protein